MTSALPSLDDYDNSGASINLNVFLKQEYIIKDSFSGESGGVPGRSYIEHERKL
jgi:hypothetical protein